MTATIGPALRRALEEMHLAPLDVTLFVAGAVPLPEPPGDDDGGAVEPSRAARVAHLEQEAERTQAPIRALLAEWQVEEVESYWIHNALAFRAPPQLIALLLGRVDVLHVELKRRARLRDLLPGPPEEKTHGWQGQPLLTANAVAVRAPQLRAASGLSGAGVLVAVIDSGINYRHPDLAGRMWTGAPLHGINLIATSATQQHDPMDRYWHGTAAAGVIAGDGTGSNTVTGMAPGATLMAVRVLENDPGPDPHQTERRIWRGFEYAVRNGAEVINFSAGWGEDLGPTYVGWRLLSHALRLLGVPCAASAGNHGNDPDPHFVVPHNVTTPADCPPPYLAGAGARSAMTACGAVGTKGVLPISSHGPVAWETPPFADYPLTAGGLARPDVCAPGHPVASLSWRYGVDASVTDPSQELNSTSAAAAHVAGGMALLVEASRRMPSGRVSLSRIHRALEGGAKRLPAMAAGKDPYLGAGILDLEAAFAYGATRGWWA